MEYNTHFVMFSTGGGEMNGLKIIAALIAVFLPIASYSAILEVNGEGQLIGATDVDVDGSYWDVVFSDGAWDFSDGTGLPASSKSDADLFSQALLDQVFLDADLGLFDSDPETTNGCENLNACIIWTPYLVEESVTYFSLAFNQRSDGVNPDMVRDVPGILGLSGNFSTDTTWTLGVWTPSSSTTPPLSAVPVPAAVWLFGTALAGLIGFSRRRKVV
jgi:hypothetical protein